MRTQLLYVVPADEPEVNCEYDAAANDESREAEVTVVHLMFTPTAGPDAVAPPPKGNRNAAESNDDYWLGGYAGI